MFRIEIGASPFDIPRYEPNGPAPDRHVLTLEQVAGPFEVGLTERLTAFIFADYVRRTCESIDAGHRPRLFDLGGT